MNEPNFKKVKMSFVDALNFYSQNFNQEDSKRWALDWVKRELPDLYDKLSSVDETLFSNRGFVCRLYDKEFPITDQEKVSDQLKKFFRDISLISREKKRDTSPVVKSDTRLCNLFEDVIDDVFSDTPHQSLNLDGSRAEKERLKEWVEKNYPHYNESFLKLKKVVELFDSVIEQTGAKKPAKKELDNKEAIRKAVKEMKYLKDFQGIVSISPSQLIGAKSAVIFNTKSSIAFVLSSEKGLQIFGTVIRGFDENSYYITTKKLQVIADEKLLAVSNLTKHKITSDSIRTTPQTLLLRSKK